jgi:hypothetical protein
MSDAPDAPTAAAAGSLPRFFRRKNDITKARSRAPLRLGLAGGGIGVSPYSEQFGGSVLNASVDVYAWCTVEVLDEERVQFVAKDLGQRFDGELAQSCPLFHGDKMKIAAVGNDSPKSLDSMHEIKRIAYARHDFFAKFNYTIGGAQSWAL